MVSTTIKPIRQRMLLDGVSWSFYERLLREIGQRHFFVTYDRGSLEITSPSWRHETYGRRIAQLILVVAEELNLRMTSGGSTTFRRGDLKKGIEPDQCFYIRNEAAIRGKTEIDLKRDPPPDLVIEVEVSRRLLNRRKIYSALGVPEVWTYRGGRLRVLLLNAGKYEPSERSRSLPMLPLSAVDRLVSESSSLDEVTWIKTVRGWVRKHLLPGEEVKP